MGMIKNSLKILESHITRNTSWWRRAAREFDSEYGFPDRMSKIEAERLYMDFKALKETMQDFEQMLDDKNVRRQYEAFLLNVKQRMQCVDARITRVMHMS